MMLHSNMPSIYESLYEKITDRSVFQQDKWYKCPVDAKTIMFLDWYYKNTGCIEFSDNRTHFRVIFWPTSTLLRLPGVSDVASNHGYSKFVAKLPTMEVQTRGIPGVCSSPDIAKMVCDKHNVPYEPKSSPVSDELPSAGINVYKKENNSPQALKTRKFTSEDFDDL